MQSILLIMIGSVSALFLLGLVITLCWSRRAVSVESPSFDEEKMEDELGSGVEQLIFFQGCEQLTIDDILNASGEVLGKSRYGTVYKARLLTGGGMIALRLLRDSCIRRPHEFLETIKDLGSIRYNHLVAILAFYSGSMGEKLLVYEYIPSGNLAELLHNANRPAPGWAKLHRIALGAARGLAYLHTCLETPIIHGNLKSKNILIDDNYEAHLSDFGLHLLMNPSTKLAMLEASASQGYKAPELLKMNKANTKTDIYSFGIILLEILTGRRPIERDSSNQIIDLPTVVKNAVLEERISDLFDPSILGGGMRSPMDEGLLRVLQLAMGCCAPSPFVRPNIKEVIRQFEKIYPLPQSPTYSFSPHYTRMIEVAENLGCDGGRQNGIFLSLYIFFGIYI